MLSSSDRRYSPEVLKKQWKRFGETERIVKLSTADMWQ